MKKLFTTLLCAFSATAFAQINEDYTRYIHDAKSLTGKSEYKAAAESYTKAFEASGGKAFVNDRYNAGCVWSLAGNKDSAFSQLFRIATKGNYTDYGHLTIDPDLTSLHGDKRWPEVTALVMANKEKMLAGLKHRDVATFLDTVFDDDQQYRLSIDETEKKYGRKSPQMTDLWNKIKYLDSVNVIKVRGILDKYGWLGWEDIGGHGVTTLFLVIQHADITTQEHYLPGMREAVKNKKANPANLALLEDRVALRRGKKQVYGSQIGMFDDGKNYISPLEDPDNVDKRRAAVGLSPLADYVAQWQLTWDPETYKKQLPEIEAHEKQFSNNAE